MLVFFVIPFPVFAADPAPCATGETSSTGYYFTSQQTVEYSEFNGNKAVIYHFKNSPAYSDGRPFKIFWTYLDEDCNSTGTGNIPYEQIIALPSGNTQWSIRATREDFAVYNDETGYRIITVQVQSFPPYSSIKIQATIDAGASTLNPKILKVDPNTTPRSFTGTLNKPTNCPQGVATGYLFDSYEHAEYINGLLQVHMRLRSPYNDGRAFQSAAATADGNCQFSLPTYFPYVTSFYDNHSRYFTFRMTSPTHWQIWDDDRDRDMPCISCSGDVATSSPFVFWYATIDAGASSIRTTPFAPVEHQIAECCSSVAFLPGLKGSILKSGSDTLWPADVFGADIPQLALNEDGTSVNPIVVDGILPNYKIHIPFLGDVGPEIYSGFSSFMDSVVASTTMNVHEWKPLAYDWRYSPDYIVSHDVDTAGGPVNLVDEIEQLAHDSNTGKITLVAHSMGGLVGKALIKALTDRGEAGLIDSFIMVGSPQLGTPQAAASLLQGDHEGIPGKTLIPNFVATRDVVRAAARNFPGAYSLLPSARYFDDVTDPVLLFAPATFTQAWRDYWGDAINAYTPFVQFLTGTGVARARPTPSLTHIPEVLRSDLVTKAGDFHSFYDSYPIPSNIRVVELAGWGQETTKAIEYKNQHFVQGYDTVPTIEGDGVVVYPSAISSPGEKYFLNLSLLNKNESSDVDHGTLLTSLPVLNTIGKVIENENVTNINYLSDTKPPITEDEAKLRVSTHSPVILGAYDGHGNFTGIYPNQNLSNDLLYVQERIPGSSFVASSDNQSIYLPKDGQYTFAYQGIGTGPTTVDIESFSNDAVTPITSYTDIPTTPQTSATFTIDATAPQDTHIQVDQNADGQIDTYFAPDGAPLSLSELLTNLTTTIQGLTIKDKLKTQLLNKITTIQKKIDKQKQKQSTVLAQLQAQVAKQAGKGKIDTATASALSSLLDSLVAQSATIPLDPVLIQQLTDEINTLPPSSLKTSLLNKVIKVTNLSVLNKSLANLTKIVTTKGQIPDTDVQNILDILSAIQNLLS